MAAEHDEKAPDLCPVNECENKAQPPENWVTCFYNGSPCQRGQAALSGRLEEVSDGR